jgi:hypothetical protein
MSNVPLVVGFSAFVCLLAGAAIGIALRLRLPGHHLADDSRHLLEISLGIIGTMAGLVLGLVVASAAASYNTQRGELLDMASKVVFLDRVLSHYGAEANTARQTLRQVVERTIDRMWPTSGGNEQASPVSAHGEVILDQLEDLKPGNDAQRSLKAEAVTLALNLGQTRWLLFEQGGSTVSMSLVVLLIFWFTITFVGFGLFAPPNPTALVALGLCALAVSGAVFVALAMYTPFEGFVQLSNAPLREALAQLGH